MTRPVDQKKAKNYLKKAEDSRYLAKLPLERAEMIALR